jgi:hypothetical protein
MSKKIQRKMLKALLKEFPNLVPMKKDGIAELYPFNFKSRTYPNTLLIFDQNRSMIGEYSAFAYYKDDDEEEQNLKIRYPRGIHETLDNFICNNFPGYMFQDDDSDIKYLLND